MSKTGWLLVLVLSAVPSTPAERENSIGRRRTCDLRSRSPGLCRRAGRSTWGHRTLPRHRNERR
jgi:hypothetical protein